MYDNVAYLEVSTDLHKGSQENWSKHTYTSALFKYRSDKYLLQRIRILNHIND